MNKFIWKSPLCEVVSIDERVIQKTKRPYAVVRVQIVAMNYPNRREGRARKGREVTLMCFTETLLPVFELGGVYVFEGEENFVWGNTYNNITKVYLESGERLLKKEKLERPCSKMGPCRECLWDGKCLQQDRKDHKIRNEDEVKEVLTATTPQEYIFDHDRIPC